MTSSTRQVRIALTANSMQNLAHFRAPVIHALAAAGYDVALVAPDDGTAIDVDHVRYHVGMDRGGVHPLRDLATIRAMRSAFRSLGPDAVLGFTPKANIYGALAARSLGIPFLPTVSGLGTAFLSGGLLRSIQSTLYRHAFANCPAVVFQNGDDRDHFMAAGLASPAQARLVPGSGVDLEHFGHRPLTEGPTTHFLFIGRLLADKGIRELAEAARQLRATNAPFRLTVVGALDDGNPSSIGEGELAAWVAEGLLQWAGPNDDVRPSIAEAHVVVLPSYREGLPRALLEAAAMGRPMVATDVPGCREVVIDEETGLLCAPGDAAALAKAMERMILMSPSMRSAMGLAARQLVEQRFDARIVARDYLALLSAQGL